MSGNRSRGYWPGSSMGATILLLAGGGTGEEREGGNIYIKINMR